MFTEVICSISVSKNQLSGISSLRASSLAWAQGLGEGEGGGKGKERELAAMSHKFECRPNAPRGSALSKLSEFGQSAQTGNER